MFMNWKKNPAQAYSVKFLRFLTTFTFINQEYMRNRADTISWNQNS